MTTPDIMSAESILIVGLARDVETVLTREILAVNEAFSEVGKVYWYVVESDSSDNTVGSLNTLSTILSRFEFVSLGKLKERLVKRTERLAFCRNVYLSKFRELGGPGAFKYLAVVDLDGVCGSLTSEAVKSCFGGREQYWDVCCANQSGPYYDIWALRHPLWSPNDCWQQARFLERFGFSAQRARQMSVGNRMITISPKADWIQVISAFGGCAIYKSHTLTDLKYSGLDETGDEICEHVEFNRQIVRNGGRIYINPRFINSGWNDHSAVKSLKSFALMRCKKLSIKIINFLKVWPSN